jgi:hypothetical protein
MKQYRITAADYSAPEPTVPDAVMDNADLLSLKRLAGITEASVSGPEGTYVNPSGILSTVGSDGGNADKLRKERETGAKPGSPEWFRIWFGDKR